MCLPARMNTLKVVAPTKSHRNGNRLKGLGIVVSIAIAAIAIFALTHTLKSIDTHEVFEVIRHTDTSLIALAAVLVITSYASLTFYDLLALRTIGRTDVSYRIAALASFTSSLTALGIGLFFAPDAISLVDFLPPKINQGLAVALLLGVVGFLSWCWFPRNIGTKRWPVRLPSGPLVLLQIVIGMFDLGAAALAMYVLIPAGPNIGIFPIMAVFIAATLLGFASHTPAGIGVFDATFLIGLGNDDKEPLVAALLMFRLMYHFLPFIFWLGVFGAVEGWRNLRRRRNS